MLITWKGKKVLFNKIIAYVFLCLLVFPVTILAKESNKETTRYWLFADSEYCFYKVYLNDLEIIFIDDTLPTSTGFTIGEYLKPTNNVLKIEVWDPDSEPGQWREDAKCSVNIKAGDPVKKIGPETITGIYFYPTNKPDLTKPAELFRDMTSVDTVLGKSVNLPQISFSAETGHYTLTREFDAHESFIEWPWYRSPSLANPLPTEQMKKLQEAYQRVWQILSNKDLPAMRKAFHEMMYEGAIAAVDSTEESYFDSADFGELFEEEFREKFVLMPLDFANKQLKFALDNKIVSMEPPPLLFCPKDNVGEHFDIDRCDMLDPRFRFDGKEFVISR